MSIENTSLTIDSKVLPSIISNVILMPSKKPKTTSIALTKVGVKSWSWLLDPGFARGYFLDSISLSFVVTNEFCPFV